MWEELKKILQERDKLGSDMRAMHDTAKKEERSFTSDENEKWDKMSARVEELKAQEERVRKLMEDRDGIDEAINALPGDTRGSNRDDNTNGDVDPEELRRSEEAVAFRALIQSRASGVSGLSPEHRAIIDRMEVRAQAVGTDGAGGYLVPEGFGDRLIETMLAFGGTAAQAFTIRTATGNDLPFPGNNDTGNAGELIAENAQVSEQDMVFTQRMLKAYMYSSKAVRVPFQLLQDSAFDIEAYLTRKLGERIGRAAAPHLAVGDGSGKPEGIVTGATAGATAGAVAAITFNDLVELEHSVDPAYRALGGCKFMFNDTTLKLLKKTADSEGRPLWLPRVGDAVPATIYGYEYATDQSMANVGASAISVVFGRLSEYYLRLVTDTRLMRLVERYADYHQVGFMAYQRLDGKLMDTAAVKRLTHPAS